MAPKDRSKVSLSDSSTSPSSSPTRSGVTASASASGGASASAPCETFAAGVEVCFAAQSHQNGLVRCKGVILEISGATASVATSAHQLAGPNDIKLSYVDCSHGTPGHLIEFVVVGVRVQHLLPTSTSGHWEPVIGITGADHQELWKTWLSAKSPYQSAAEEATPQQSKQQPDIPAQNLTPQDYAALLALQQAYAGGGIEDSDASSDSSSDSDLNPFQSRRPKPKSSHPFVQSSSSGRKLAGTAGALPVPDLSQGLPTVEQWLTTGPRISPQGMPGVSPKTAPPQQPVNVTSHTFPSAYGPMPIHMLPQFQQALGLMPQARQPVQQKRKKKKKKKKRSSSSSSSGHSSRSDGGLRKYQNVRKMHKSFFKHPAKLHRQFVQTSRENAGCAPGEPFVWRTLNKSIVWGKLKGIQRCHGYVGDILTELEAKDPTRAGVGCIQLLKALHQVAIDQGSWNVAVHYLPSRTRVGGGSMVGRISRSKTSPP